MAKKAKPKKTKEKETPTTPKSAKAKKAPKEEQKDESLLKNEQPEAAAQAEGTEPSREVVEPEAAQELQAAEQAPPPEPEQPAEELQAAETPQGPEAAAQPAEELPAPEASGAEPEPAAAEPAEESPREEAAVAEAVGEPEMELEPAQEALVAEEVHHVDVLPVFDERLQRTFTILEVSREEEAFVNEANLSKYFAYLKQSVELPASVVGATAFDWEKPYIWGLREQQEHDKLKEKNPSCKDTYELIGFDDEIDPIEGILVRVRRTTDQKEFLLPLAYLRASEASKNAQILKDYSDWFVNCR